MTNSGALSALSIALAVSFSAFGANAENAGNFQFLVKAEDGLQLSITGFGSDGRATFQGIATKQINLIGKPTYSILIGRDIVFAGFAVWCVQDQSKKWSLPASYGKQPGDLLCDRQPRDDGKGTYVFKVR